LTVTIGLVLGSGLACTQGQLTTSGESDAGETDTAEAPDTETSSRDVVDGISGGDTADGETTDGGMTDGGMTDGEASDTDRLDTQGTDTSSTDTPPEPTCSDGVRNGGEDGVDCGGPDCPACPTYTWQTGTWSDCKRNSCSKTRSVTCKRDDGMTVDDGECPPLKPDTSQSCSLTTSPSISGSWRRQCRPRGGCDEIAKITTSGSTITIESDGFRGNTGTLTLTDSMEIGRAHV